MTCYTRTHDYSTAILSYMSRNRLVNMSMFSDSITEVGSRQLFLERSADSNWFEYLDV